MYRYDHRLMIRSGEFRLAQQRPGPHYALVRVTVERSSYRRVVVADDAFEWLAAEYGPAHRTGSATVSYTAEAADGARYALAAAAAAAAVTVAEIRFANADTAPGDIRLASAWAVWHALGYEPDHGPWIDDAGVHFPEPGDGSAR